MRLRHALAVLLGTLLGAWQSVLWNALTYQLVLVLALVLAVLAFAQKTRPHYRTGLALAACALFGFGYVSMVAQQRLEQRFAPLEARGDSVEVVAEVIDLPRRGELAGRDATRLSLRLQASPALGATRQVRVGYYGTEVIRAGELWRMQLKLRAPRGEVNPGGFDFEKLAASQGIDAVGYVQQLGSRQAEGRGILALRERLSEQIGAAIEAPFTRALVQALAVGDTRGLTHANWEFLRQTGLTHLIAISGLHITLLASLGAGLAWAGCWLMPGLTRRVPRRQICLVVGLLCAGAYALLAGFGVPAQRTLLMLASLCLGLVLRRVHTLWQGYALALLVVLLADPLVVLSAGAWLSFVAVGLLILVLSERFPRPGWWRSLVSSQVLMSVGLLPLSLVFFAQASLLAPFANLIAVPLVTLVVVPIVLLGTLLALGAQPGLAASMFQLAAWLWQCLLDLLSMLPQSWNWSAATPSALALVLAAIAIALMFAPAGMPLRRWSPLLLLPLFIPPKPATPRPGEFILTALDIGQGLSVLIQTQHHTLLYDTGPGLPEGANAGESTVVPSLRALGVRELAMIMLSHSDSDHAGGLTAVRRAFPAAELRSSAVEDLAIAFKVKNAVPCLAGQHWQWDGVQFDVLHPNPGLPYLRNQSSCVLKISATANSPGRAASVLLTGDIDAVIESRLLRTQADKLNASLLFATHHGSADGSTDQFLAAVAPQSVIFPAGFANRFDFPRQETIQRVSATGAQRLTIGEVGAVHATFDSRSGQWQLQTQRALERRWWRY